jgi:hypothetical protein
VASYFLHTPNEDCPEDGTAKTVLKSHGLPGIEESPHDHNPHNAAASSSGAKEFNLECSEVSEVSEFSEKEFSIN